MFGDVLVKKTNLSTLQKRHVRKVAKFAFVPGFG